MIEVIILELEDEPVYLDYLQEAIRKFIKKENIKNVNRNIVIKSIVSIGTNEKIDECIWNNNKSNYKYR